MDDNIETLLLLLLTVVLVVLNGFFVATEFAIVRVRSTRIKELAENGNVSAQYTARALKQLDSYLSAAQLGITLASLGLGWVGEPVIVDRIIMPLMHRVASDEFMVGLGRTISFILAFSLITVLHIVFGEQAPKWLAIQRAERTAMWVIRPMAVCVWLFKPFVIMLNGMANSALRLVGVRPGSEEEQVHSEEELRMIISASADNGGTLRETQAELLDNVFDFGTRLARQVMRHRTEIEVLDAEEPLAENVHIAQEGGHTRYPVIAGDIDEIIGFVHTKDLFALFQRAPEGDIREIMREALIVPETIRVDLLLRQLQRTHQHMAMLVDEYGGTSGVVTVADLLELLVGEMPDEFEQPEEEWVVPLTDDAWSVDGRLPLTDLEEVLARDLPCEDACDTVGGYAYWAFGRIPALGDAVEKSGIRVSVTAMDGHRVSRVEIVRAAEGVRVRG